MLTGDDLLAIPVPGHTKGSVVFLFEERCLFTGDSLSWDFTTNDLRAGRRTCWYSWPEQTASLIRLAASLVEFGLNRPHFLIGDDEKIA